MPSAAMPRKASRLSCKNGPRSGNSVFSSHLPSAICHLPFAICHLPSAICHLPFVIRYLPSGILNLMLPLPERKGDIAIHGECLENSRGSICRSSAAGNGRCRFGCLVRFGVEPGGVELDPPILPHCEVGCERDDRVGQGNLATAAGLVVLVVVEVRGIAVAHAIGEVLELFAIPAGGVD